MKKIILLSSFLAIQSPLHAASGIIDWSLDNQFDAGTSNPTFNDAVYEIRQDGTTAVRDDDRVDSILSPGEVSPEVLAGSLATISVSGTVINTGLTTSLMELRLEKDAGDNWGGVPGLLETGSGTGPDGQIFGGSGLLFLTEGGPWASTDGNITTTIDFRNYTGGGVSNLELSLLGINRQRGSGGGASLDGSDIVSVSATDENGTSISDISGFFTTATAGNTSFAMSGTDTVVFDASGSTIQANGQDHTNSDGNVAFDSGTQMIQSLTITYRATSAGTAANRASSGFLVTDFAFETIPEPSVALLSALGLASLTLRRKRSA